MRPQGNKLVVAVLSSKRQLLSETGREIFAPVCPEELWPRTWKKKQISEICRPIAPLAYIQTDSFLTETNKKKEEKTINKP